MAACLEDLKEGIAKCCFMGNWHVLSVNTDRLSRTNFVQEHAFSKPRCSGFLKLDRLLLAVPWRRRKKNTVAIEIGLGPGLQISLSDSERKTANICIDSAEVARSTQGSHQRLNTQLITSSLHAHVVPQNKLEQTTDKGQFRR